MNIVSQKGDIQVFPVSGALVQGHCLILRLDAQLLGQDPAQALVRATFSPSKANETAMQRADALYMISDQGSISRIRSCASIGTPLAHVQAAEETLTSDLRSRLRPTLAHCHRGLAVLGDGKAARYL